MTDLSIATLYDNSGAYAPEMFEAPESVVVAPDTGANDDDAVEITVTGTGFFKRSIILFDGQKVPTTFVDDTELTATVSLVGRDAGDVDVAVRNTRKHVSEPDTFTITEAEPLAISALVPDTGADDEDALELTVEGTGFTETCVVTFDGDPLETALVEGDLVVTVDLTGYEAGEVDVVVVDGDDESDPAVFTITEAV